MTTQQLNRAIARATGESISEISRRGFVLLCDEQQNEDLELPIDDPDDNSSDEELVGGRRCGFALDH